MSDMDESTISYLAETPSESLRSAAWDAPMEVGCDSSGGETFLDGNVLGVRWVSDQSAVTHFGLEVHELGGAPATVLRIDYETWAMPSEFDPELPESVVFRREHVYVTASVLLDGYLFSYGLGPEYGYLRWESDNETDAGGNAPELGEDGLKVLIDAVEEQYISEISEHLSQSGIPDGLSKGMLTLYEKVNEQNKVEDAAYEEELRRKAQEKSALLSELHFNTVDVHVVDDSSKVMVICKSIEGIYWLSAEARLAPESDPIRVEIELSPVSERRVATLPVATASILTKVKLKKELQAELLRLLLDGSLHRAIVAAGPLQR